MVNAWRRSPLGNVPHECVPGTLSSSPNLAELECVDRFVVALARSAYGAVYRCAEQISRLFL